MYQIIQEGKAKIEIAAEKKISKKLPVFYNPVMEFNRNISVLILNIVDNKNMQIALPLAGTGIRGIRFLKELNKNKVKSISFNDHNPNFKKIMDKNLKLNKLKSKKIQIFNQDANLFLLNSKGFDYIDIDPFGTPNPFLDSAAKRISRNGILAVTATDTAPLAGTYPNKCIRAYWAAPKRDSCMHETGLRILIRKIQLIGSQYEKALIPIFSFYKDHYLRVFFRCVKSNSEIDKLLKQHKMINATGPLWIGNLFDLNLIKKIKIDELQDKELIKFIKIIREESKINVVGFYEMNDLIKKLKIKSIKKNELIKKIQKAGYKASETHFSPNGVKTDIKLEKLLI